MTVLQAASIAPESIARRLAWYVRSSIRWMWPSKYPRTSPQTFRAISPTGGEPAAPQAPPRPLRMLEPRALPLDPFRAGQLAPRVQYPAQVAKVLRDVIEVQCLGLNPPDIRCRQVFHAGLHSRPCLRARCIDLTSTPDRMSASPRSASVRIRRALTGRPR